MNETINYYNNELDQWMENVFTEERRQLINESLAEIAQFYQHEYEVDERVLDFLRMVDSGQYGDLPERLSAMVNRWLKQLVNQYGIQLHEDEVEILDTPIYLVLLRTLNQISTWEDVMAIHDILVLGNSDIEKFIQLVLVVEPDQDEAVLFKVIRDVSPGFFHELAGLIKDEVEKQQAISEYVGQIDMQQQQAIYQQIASAMTGGQVDEAMKLCLDGQGKVEIMAFISWVEANQAEPTDQEKMEKIIDHFYQLIWALLEPYDQLHQCRPYATLTGALLNYLAQRYPALPVHDIVGMMPSNGILDTTIDRHNFNQLVYGQLNQPIQATPIGDE